VTKIYDEFCAWPYVLPYGWVAAPKKPKEKKPRKPRTPRAKPDWLKAASKPKKPKKPKKPRKSRAKKSRPVPLDFFVNRPPIIMDEFAVYNPAEE
jgi:hypothetical protein